VLGLVMRPINDKFSSSFHRVLFNISDLALSMVTITSNIHNIKQR
jgi:hypothetical protein